MSQLCAIVSCNRVSRALCHCCQQDVCIFHLNEHNNSLITKLNPLANAINTLDNRLRTMNIQKVIGDYHQKLEQWRIDSHKKVDHFFEQKCQELDRLVAEKVDEQREELARLQSEIDELIWKQEATQQNIHSLTSTIDHLEREINNIEEKFVEVHTQPLILDTNLITIKGINEHEYDLSIISRVTKIISRPDGSYVALAGNHQYLLIHQVPNLCLISLDLAIIQQIPWRHGVIYDICWSLTMNRFIVIDEKNIYLVDENTMSIEKMQLMEKRKWFSCTCSDKFLFLSTNEWGSSITKISLLPTKKFGKQYQSPKICESDEYIDAIAYNKKKLAMIIRNKSKKTIRMELRHSESLDLIWPLQLEIAWNPNKPFHCCPFICDDWLVADYETGRLLHIVKEGKIKSTVSYKAIPYCITLFGRNMLAVSSNDGLNFHNLTYEKTYTIFVL